METKFTKGPWFAGGNPCEANEKEKALAIVKESIDLTNSGSGYFMEVYLEDGLRIAICGNGPNGINNAHLIAAAPDLYEALDRVHKLISQFSESGFNPLTEPEIAEELFLSQGQRFDALKKARGEQP